MILLISISGKASDPGKYFYKELCLKFSNSYTGSATQFNTDNYKVSVRFKPYSYRSTKNRGFVIGYTSYNNKRKFLIIILILKK